MSEQDQADKLDVISLTAEMVASYVSHNAIPTAELPTLISSIHGALTGLGGPTQPSAEKPSPMVSVKKSVTPDYIISLEDGRQYKSLKRHLSGRGLTPEGYRDKWGLPPDYPMVASNYAKQRSALAKSMGLGRGARKADAGEAAEEG